MKPKANELMRKKMQVENCIVSMLRLEKIAQMRTQSCQILSLAAPKINLHTVTQYSLLICHRLKKQQGE
jgi:hypothetical protein